MNINAISESGFYQSGFGLGSPAYFDVMTQAQAWESDLMKAYQTGEGVVTPSGISADNTFRNARVQFLHNVLEKTSFDQEDAGMMKKIVKQRVYSNTFEWSQFNAYGGPGDGFTPENGTDGAFNVSSSDDVFTRLLRQIKFLAAVREVGFVSQMVRNIEDPMGAAEEAATLELIAKMNLAIYFGDSALSKPQCDGIVRQLLDWISPNSVNNGYGNASDQAIIYDANNSPIDQYLLNNVAVVNRNKYGRGDELWQSVTGKADTQKLLYPYQRTELGGGGDAFGVDRNEFKGMNGLKIKLFDDVMLRPGRPLAADGPSSTGAIRDGVISVADTGAPAWTGGITGATATAGTVGTTSFWLNQTVAGVVPSAAPALPGGAGNQTNQTPPATYYYAVAPVYNGKEGSPYVIGATGAGTVTGASGKAVTATNCVVTITIDGTQLANNTTYIASQLKWRVYRYGGPGLAAPTALTQFTYLMECGSVYTNSTSGTVTSGNICYDNGMYTPGSDNAFLMTSKKGRTPGYFLAQLLPLMKRQGLPEKVMSSPLALLLFASPIMVSPRHHIHIRNVGPAN